MWVIQPLYFESIMWILCFKPSFFFVFSGNETSFYLRDIVGLLIKIFLRGAIFLNDYNDVIFTYFFRRYIAIPNKILYLILTPF